MAGDERKVSCVELSSLFDPRLLLVSGKGGVGKSTLAAAVAVAGTRTGRKTCLVEVEGRQTMSRFFGTPPWDFTERQFRPGLWGMSIDPEASLAEYLDMFYGAKRVSRLVAGNTAVEFATTAAPGIKDVLLIGKVKEMERRRGPDGRFVYDLIVMDAPPTGRIVNFLRSPEATTQLVNVGPIRAQAQTVVDLLSDPRRTRMELVTVLEEMPVQETVESIEALQSLGVSVGPVLVNRVLADRFPEDAVRKALTDDLEAGSLQALLASAGLELSPEGAQGLLDAGLDHLERLALQDRMRAQLQEELGLPLLELPFLHTAEFAAAEVTQLAEIIGEVVSP